MSIPSSQTPAFLSDRMEIHFARFRDEWGEEHIMAGRKPGRDAVLLRSNDYLALSGDKRIIRAQIAELEQGENAPMMSAVFESGGGLRERFETEMAGFLDADEIVTLQTGYNANVGLIQSIASEKVPVYIDIFAHYSLWEGITVSGAKAYPFRHNSAGHLERLLKIHGPGIIIIDSVYSNSGSIAPIGDIANLAIKNDCVLVVDESHSIGVFGYHGEGLVSSLGLADKVHFRTASLAKAFCGIGGIIAGPAKYIEFIRNEARPIIFSSALLPASFAAFIATLKIIKNADEKREKLRILYNTFREGLDEIGFNVAPSNSQIICITPGPEVETKEANDFLQSRDIFGSIFCAPATAKNRSMIRFSLNADLDLNSMDRVLAVCRDLFHEKNARLWPSTVKKKGFKNRLSEPAGAP